MLDTKELDQVRDYVIKILPELLRSEPEIATTIEGILAQQFPRRDEFARLLDEVQASRQATREGFEQVGHNLEEIKQSQLGMRRDMAKLQSGQITLSKQVSGMQTWIDFVVGNLRNEKGQTLEDMFAAALQYGLNNPAIFPDSIRLRQPLIDQQGEFFARGYATEVDLIAEDGGLIVFEVKASAKPGEVGFFALKAKLVAAQNPDKQVRGVFITLAPTPEVRDQCQRDGIELVDKPVGLF